LASASRTSIDGTQDRLLSVDFIHCLPGRCYVRFAGPFPRSRLGTSKTIIRSAPMHSSLKLFSYVVILLMAIAMLYSAYISIKYWAGIGV
jgi:hypothetical protein